MVRPKESRGSSSSVSSESDSQSNHSSLEKDAAFQSTNSSEQSESGSATLSQRQQTFARLKEIAQKIQNGEFETVHMSVVKSKVKLASFWNEFRPVRDAKTKVPQQAAQCNKCAKVFMYQERLSGSNSLTRHMQHCQFKNDGLLGNLHNKIDPPKEAKGAFTTAVAHYCALGLRAPKAMSDTGMVNLIQTTLDLGAAHATFGRLDARKLIPCPSTVSKYMAEEAEKAKEETAAEVIPAIREYRCAATSDCWTDDYKKEKYITLTAHYLQDWTMQNRMLFTSSLDGEASTAENLKAALLTEAEKLGITSELFGRLKFITDGGSDIKKALEDYDWYYCLAHSYNIVLRTSLSVKYASMVEAMLSSNSYAENLVAKANQWVREVRSSQKVPKKHSLLSKLKVSNPQSQGHLPPLLAVCAYRGQVEKLLGPCEAQELLKHISEQDVEEMRALSDLLVYFDLEGKREASAHVSTSRYPTLAKHLEDNTDDSPMITALKAVARNELLPMNLLLVIELCKDLVAYLKRSGMNQLLTRTTKQEVSTRWNSHLDMLLSILTQWDDIQRVLDTGKGKAKWEDIDIDVVEMIVDYLSPFAAHTDKLQGQKYPTLPYVTLTFEKLLQHCCPKVEDSPAMAAVRAKAYTLLCVKVAIKEDHKLATFLWPRMKQMQMYPSQWDKAEIYAAARRRLAVIAEREQPIDSLVPPQPSTSAITAPASPVDSAVEQPPPKRPRLAVTDEELYGSFMLQPSITVDEVQRYINMEECDIGDDSDILQWWKTQGVVRFPRLAKLANSLFGMPATSAPSERTFSDLGLLLSERRCNMHPRTASNTLSLRDNLRNKQLCD